MLLFMCLLTPFFTIWNGVSFMFHYQINTIILSGHFPKMDMFILFPESLLAM